jgi:hypothetical protein
MMALSEYELNHLIHQFCHKTIMSPKIGTIRPIEKKCRSGGKNQGEEVLTGISCASGLIRTGWTSSFMFSKVWMVGRLAERSLVGQKIGRNNSIKGSAEVLTTACCQFDSTACCLLMTTVDSDSYE